MKFFKDTTVSKLPDDLLAYIFKYLEAADLAAINNVCKHFYSLIKSEKFKKVYSDFWLADSSIQKSIEQQTFRLKSKLSEKLIQRETDINQAVEDISILQKFTNQKIEEFKKADPDKSIQLIRYYRKVQPIAENSIAADTALSTSKCAKYYRDSKTMGLTSLVLACIILLGLGITELLDGKKNEQGEKVVEGLAIGCAALAVLLAIAAYIGRSYFKKSEISHTKLKLIDERSPLLDGGESGLKLT